MSALDVWKGDRPSQSFGSMEPFSRDFERLFRDMDRLVGPMRTWSGESVEFIPTCDIDETEEEYHFTMDVPGIEKKDIKIEVVGNAVNVSGERKKEFEQENATEYRRERSYGKFLRSFAVPDGVKGDKIEANYDNGVLSLTLPKSEKSKSKRIEIKSGKPVFIAKLSGKEKRKASNE